MVILINNCTLKRNRGQKNSKQWAHVNLFVYLFGFAPIPTNSILKYKVAFGGITPPAPLDPYPSVDGIIISLFPPTFILVNRASSQPGKEVLLQFTSWGRNNLLQHTSNNLLHTNFKYQGTSTIIAAVELLFAFEVIEPTGVVYSDSISWNWLFASTNFSIFIT